MLTLGGDRIRVLRAVGAPRDPLALRLYLERALGSADLRPRGLPPRAIVCVRRMRLPMPSRDPRAWATRIDQQMQDLLLGRARPFREVVPANADVVVFLDEAELLACLARDWLRGDGHAWWWRTLLGEAASATVVQRAFVEAPPFVPAAIELLAHQGLAAEVVHRLPSPYCERVGAAVAWTFAVPEWGEVLREPSGPFEAREPGHVAAATASPYAAKLDAALDGVVDAGRSAALSPSQRALLALALLLRRAPAVARAPGSVAVLRERVWSTRSGASSARTETAAPVRLGPPGTATRAPVSRAADGVSSRRDHESDVQEAGGESSDDTCAMEDSDTPRVVIDLAPGAVQVLAPPEVGTQPGSPVGASAGRAAKAPADDGVFVDSAFAGVVYLVNVALYLDIYGDFTQPARPGLALPLGDFLALVGERAVGPSLRDDALWALLAELAGREEREAPGCGFMPPDDGVPRCEPPVERLQRDPLAHWLDGVVRTLDARAGLALGLEEGAALPFLCARAGRVALSPTRLDATFTLADHPLEIRLAGLDRNPGWVPAAGRFIELHYE